MFSVSVLNIKNRGATAPPCFIYVSRQVHLVISSIYLLEHFRFCFFQRIDVEPNKSTFLMFIISISFLIINNRGATAPPIVQLLFPEEKKLHQEVPSIYVVEHFLFLLSEGNFSKSVSTCNPQQLNTNKEQMFQSAAKFCGADCS